MSPVSFHFYNKATRKFEITCVAHNTFLLDSTSAYNGSQSVARRPAHQHHPVSRCKFSASPRLTESKTLMGLGNLGINQPYKRACLNLSINGITNAIGSSFLAGTVEGDADRCGPEVAVLS